ncbi:MAG: response regulator transcription factor, partial [bacterium]
MRVLVIEDEHGIANAIKKGLEQERYTVDVEYDGEAGFDLASEDVYDLIILDLMLPKMDGLTVCRKLRSDNIHTPILMLTARGQLNDKVKGLDSGADDYLVKPFAFVELLARIRALTRRPKQTLSETLSVGDLTINLVSFQVARAGKEVTLS